MKKIISFLTVSTFVVACSVYADTNVKSKLFIQQDGRDAVSNIADNSNKVDFFELAKKNEEPLPKPNWDTSATVNMSEHDRSQYLFNQRNYSELNNHINMQRVDALKNARDQGRISNKEYQKEIDILKMQNKPKGPGTVGFSIPWE